MIVKKVSWGSSGRDGGLSAICAFKNAIIPGPIEQGRCRCGISAALARARRRMVLAANAAADELRYVLKAGESLAAD